MNSSRRTRKQKEAEYKERYGDIPVDYEERLAWLYDELRITPRMASDIVQTRLLMLHSLTYHQTQIRFFEVPEGTPRGRFRIVNRKNLADMAIAASQFVHVYSPNAHEDQVYMKRLVTQEELFGLNSLICTPCNITIDAYLRTPSNFSKRDIMLAEMGLHRPLKKPDWDNIEKKYSDMFNHNVWLDDTFVVDGTIHRYFSVLPRVEVTLSYLNMVTSEKQWAQIISRSDYDPATNLRYYGQKE